MNSKWSQDKKNRLKEIMDNASSKKEGFAQAAEELGFSVGACNNTYYRYIFNKARDHRNIFNTPKAVKVFRKNLKKYSGNLYGEAFPRIAESLNQSVSTIQNVYYGYGKNNCYRTCKCYRYNLKPSFCLLNLGNTFHRKNFNSVPEKHTKKSVLEIIKAIFKF